jgi:DNA-binding transcriptional ArsR family regulator
MTMTQRQSDGAIVASQAVRLLDVASDLADALPEGTRDFARGALVVEGADFAAGPWSPPPRDGLLGLLVLDGFLIRRVILGGAGAAELLGPGDFLNPWDEGTDGLIHVKSRLAGLSTGRIVVLDGRFAHALARFPQILPALAARSAQRSQRAAVLMAIGHMKRIEDRLAVFFAHAAGEWGRVSADGIVLPLAMPHSLVAEFIGAERPSVTTSLGRLRERGLVTRREDRTWLLAHDIGEAATAALWSSPIEEVRSTKDASRALSAQAEQAIRHSRELLDGDGHA